jgi:hypothetical protein
MDVKEGEYFKQVALCRREIAQVVRVCEVCVVVFVRHNPTTDGWRGFVGGGSCQAKPRLRRCLFLQCQVSSRLNSTQHLFFSSTPLISIKYFTNAYS